MEFLTILTFFILIGLALTGTVGKLDGYLFSFKSGYDVLIFNAFFLILGEYALPISEAELNAALLIPRDLTEAAVPCNAHEHNSNLMEDRVSIAEPERKWPNGRVTINEFLWFLLSVSILFFRFLTKLFQDLMKMTVFRLPVQWLTLRQEVASNLSQRLEMYSQL